MFVGNAFTSLRNDRDESTLAPGTPAARLIAMSAMPKMNVSDTLITIDRSLPSHSMLNTAMMASVAEASMEACTALPSERLANPTFQR